MKQKNYPLNEVQSFQSIKHMMELCVEQAGDRPAFRYKLPDKSVRTVTYREFMKDTECLGTALSSMGLLDLHIAVIGENSYPWVTVYLTVLKSHGVLVPVDKELPLEDLIHVLEHSDSELLFLDKKHEKDLPALMEALPNIRYWIGFDAEEDRDNLLSYQALLQRGKEQLEAGDTSYTSIQPNTGELRMIVYTSGTTGMAKGVMLPESNLVNMVYHGLSISTVYTTCLSVLPYHHTYEGVAGLLVSLHHHSCICINENMKAILKNLQLYQPDYIYVVPAFVELFYKKIWANAKESKKATALGILIRVSNFLRLLGIDLRHKLFGSIHEAFGGKMRKIVTGGAPIRGELGEFFDSIGIDLINGYGITECSPLISVNRDYFNDCSTVGVLVPCLELKFDNPTSDGSGEICVKGATVMQGYYKDEERTNEVLVDGWFHTGDYGRLNDKGQLIITGRKKNLIVLRNGKNVFPEEIENRISSIPYITEVIVSGIKNQNNEEDGLCAELFLNQDELKKMEFDNLEKMVKEDIDRVCAKLPLYKHINQIKIREVAFEKTTTNKIKR